MSSEKKLQPPPGYPSGGKEKEEKKEEEKLKDEEGEEDETKSRCIGARMGGGYNMISTGYGYGPMGGRARPPGRYPGPFDNYDEPPRVPYYGGAPNYGYGGGGGRGRGRYCAQVQVEYEGGRAIYPNDDCAEFEGELDYEEGYGLPPNVYKGRNNKMSPEYYQQQQSQYANEGSGHHGPPLPRRHPVYAPEVVYYRRREYGEY